MATALPFPMHKHPPVRAGILQAAGSAASQATAAVGEDQGTPGEAGAEAGADAGAAEAGPEGGAPPRAEGDAPEGEAPTPTAERPE